ncbi:hypothetical protein OESDEN_04904, partial [Oesophagostomum dentatum]
LYSSENVGDNTRRRTIGYVEKGLDLEDVSDEEDDIQMTKLDKPSIRVVKRVPESNGVSLNESNDDALHSPETVVRLVSKGKNTVNESGPATKAEQSADAAVENVPSDSKPTEDSMHITAPADNVWTKRQEERESQEREKVRLSNYPLFFLNFLFPYSWEEKFFQLSRVSKIMQQAIEQHFPSVSEAASIKIDKDSTRRPADSDFARATLRARRQQGSNDVRQLMYAEDTYQRRAATHAQRPECDTNNRIQSSAKLVQKEQQRLEHKDLADPWSKNARRQIAVRGKYVRNRGRTGVLAPPQIFRRSSATKRSEKGELLGSEEVVSVNISVSK